MTVSFRALVETDSNGTVTRTLALGSGVGRWTDTSGSPFTEGAAQEYVLTVRTNDTTVDIVVALFNRRAEGVFEGGLAFIGDPALAKTSIRIHQWPRVEGHAIGRIELVLALDEDLNNVTRSESLGGSGTTTYVINGGNNITAVGRKTVRLSKDALADGHFLAGSVESRVDVVESAIVVTLPSFETTLVYDPDLGVLFGSPSRDGDPNDRGTSSSASVQTTLIVAVAASVGGAAILVLFTVTAITGALWYRRRRLAATVGPAVAFDPESPAVDQL
ncbi:hypothetical protein pmac_cds_568 [Pandoravirus macleodensis]|uniref:Uncharacterized protein n=1 Tax=Pandoravirus macleodensis TaxID=2107707 RepID=A0A2U7UFM7_9VIRU|nr:hypothetical protein pmac_cds_568 [Pandoravirus macleodensis]AVK77256.1 hypothetical protein pmac_cds_568 [Pandoravirus macleodensis]UMO79991.1 hypothetical protein [Pandoravirus aubagnensis]